MRRVPFVRSPATGGNDSWLPLISVPFGSWARLSTDPGPASSMPPICPPSRHRLMVPSSAPLTNSPSLSSSRLSILCCLVSIMPTCSPFLQRMMVPSLPPLMMSPLLDSVRLESSCLVSMMGPSGLPSRQRNSKPALSPLTTSPFFSLIRLRTGPPLLPSNEATSLPSRHRFNRPSDPPLMRSPLPISITDDNQP